MGTEKLGVSLRRYISMGNNRYENRRHLDILTVVVYKPYKTKKGRYIWRKDKVIQSGFRYGSWWNEYKHLPVETYHNKPMTPDEVIQMMAEEGLEK
jgi:hypothetical protein